MIDFWFSAFVLIVAIIGVILFWYRAAQRQEVLGRLSKVESEADVGETSELPFASRWWWMPWILVIPVVLMLSWYWTCPWNLAIGVGFVLGLVGMEIDAWFYQWRLSRIEAQLAEAIDVLVASVGAGSSLQASLLQASEFSPLPLRTELAEIVARLRLGDSPPDVFGLLQQRVPTETFRLFSTTLTVNWQVGGELSETLAAIGSTIRGRLAIARQLRTLSTQGTLTTLAVLGVTWFMAAMMWQADPPRFLSFLFSTVGSWVVAASLFLEGIGIALVSRLSRPKI